jgi:hypothetical protein
MFRIANPNLYAGLGLFLLVFCVAVFGASMLGANDGDRAAACSDLTVARSKDQPR